MRDLSIDIETYGSTDLNSAGVYKYAESEDFKILLIAYKEDDADTRVIDLERGELLPESITLALKDRSVVKHAYNAVFEWYCLNKAGYETPIDQWRCTMIHGLYCGFPAGLEALGKTVGLPGVKQKHTTGKALIKYFCKPIGKPFARARHLPEDDPEKWFLFKEYNRQDVETEYAIQQILNHFPVPDTEWDAWREDTLLNARGIQIDAELVKGALEIDAAESERLKTRAQELTRLDNPKSNKQMLGWLTGQGIAIDNMRKETVSELLKDEFPEKIREALRLKQRLSKTSVTKYAAMKVAECADGRVRGLLQFYGASRTGRFAGRLVQVQNLPRNYLATLDDARKMVKAKNHKGLRMIYGNVPDTLSQLIRTAFIPAPGKKFIVSDFSAIEARVIAWLAGEDWVLDVFKNGGDIYCAAASQMFGIPVVKHGVNGELRQKGKIATLALGYQGGKNALIKMGALNMGLQEDELPEIVDKWRYANPNIVSFWHNIERLATHTINTGETTYLKNLELNLEGDIASAIYFLTVKLPSGRKLFYNNPVLGNNKFGKPSLTYMGVDQTTKRWCRQETYGGKLTENVVQAIARDCLVLTLRRCTTAGYTPVMHIHDEIVIEADPEQKLEVVNAIFAKPVPWAPGLPLKGDGFEALYYKKD